MANIYQCTKAYESFITTWLLGKQYLNILKPFYLFGLYKSPKFFFFFLILEFYVWLTEKHLMVLLLSFTNQFYFVVQQ